MSSLTFSIDLNGVLYQKIANDYENGNFSSAIKTAILFLSETIRERTDLDLDGDQLITKAFSLKDPLIKINNLKTQTDMDEQLGYMLIFQGMYKAIRNPRNHNLIIDKKPECDSLLVFFNYLLSIIEKAKPKFDYIDFLDSINDIYFTQTSQYADEITKMVPKEKMLDVALKLCNDISKDNYSNIPYIINSLKKHFSQHEKDIFLQSCNIVLAKTIDIVLIKSYLMFLSDDWASISKASQLRIINLLLDTFEHMKIIYETTTNENNNYETIEFVDENGEFSRYLKYLPHKYSSDMPFITIKNIIAKKMRLGENYAEFILSSFYYYFVDEKNNIYPAFEELFTELLKSGSKATYNFLISTEGEPRYSFSKEINNAIKSFVDKRK